MYYGDERSSCAESPGYLEYDCKPCPVPQQEFTYMNVTKAGAYKVAVNLFELHSKDYPFAYKLYASKNGADATEYSGVIESSTPTTTDLPGCGECRAQFYTVDWP